MTAKHAKTPKAFVNVRNVGFAKISEATDSETVYDDALLTRGVKNVATEGSGEIKVAYADGMEIESGRNNGQRTLTLLMHAFGTEVRELLFGDEPDENGVVAERRNQTLNEVAFWFKHERNDGSFKLYGFPRVLFNEPNLEAAQESDDYEYSEEESSGMAMWRQEDEVRRLTYDSSKENGSVEDFLKRLLGDEHEIEEIAANLKTSDNPGSDDGGDETP